MFGINDRNELMATLIDGEGHRTEYFPYAAFALEGVEYLVLRSSEPGIGEEVLVLESQEDAQGQRMFSLAQTTPKLQALILQGLGLSYGLIQ